MANEVSVVPDPFADDLFSELDTRDEGSLKDALQKIADEDPAGIPPPLEDIPEDVPAPPAAPIDEPKVVEYEDGSSVTIEHGSRGWKATLDSNTGAPAEVFYGTTKDEMMLNLAAGKMNATRKIREMNKRMKLESLEAAEPVPAPVTETAGGHVLTADEIFEIKTDLASDPGLAMDKWFQKRTGMSADELVRLAKIGKAASDELTAETVSREFLTRHPEYVSYEKNFTTLIAWLCKYKLHSPLGDRDPNDMVGALFTHGHWTGKKLDEAYEDLKDDGLLDLRPEEEPAGEVEETVLETPAPPAAKPVTPVTPAPAKPAASRERIASETRRPRAGQGSLGIRAKETTSGSAVDSTRPPSDEELNNLSDEQVSELFSGVRKLRLGTRR